MGWRLRGQWKWLLTVCVIILIPSLVYLYVRAELPRPQSGRPIWLDAVLQRLDEVRPGTVIGQSAPKGWTHLILKSHPKVSAEDSDKVSDWTAGLASFIFTTTLADVGETQIEGQSDYFLRRVGLGIGTQVQGKDMVLSPKTQYDLGAKLGFFQQRVFKEVYAKQAEARLVAATRTMGIFDTVAIVWRGGHNRQSIIRYVILVDGKTGSLNTFAWCIELDDQGRYRQALNPMQWLPKNKIARAMMRVDPSQGLASDLRFGIAHIAQGNRVSFPKKMAAIAAAPTLTEEHLLTFEQSLRKVVDQGD